MKKILSYLSILAIGSLILASCHSSSFSYSSYTPKPNPDFSKYKTFAFMDFTTKKQLDDNMLSGLLAIEASITEQMQKRGFSKTDREKKPDLLINLGTFLSQKTEYTESVVAIYPEQNVFYWSSLSYETRYDPVVYQSNIKAQKYEEGNLLVDLIDAKDNSLVWHGNISHIFKENIKNVDLENLDKQIILLFDKEFPKK